MTLQRGNREGAIRSGDSSDEGFGLAWVAAAEQRVRRSRGDASVDSRPCTSEGGEAPRVLLVDDNYLLVKSLARWLDRYGCDERRAHSAPRVRARRGRLQGRADAALDNDGSSADRNCEKCALRAAAGLPV
jgi:hypothetical protein